MTEAPQQPADVSQISQYPFDIVGCADKDIKLWENQTAYLRWLQENYDKYDVLVCASPVGTGKSRMASTTATWMEANGLGKVTMLAMSRMLQDQYGDVFHWLPVLKGADNYPCQEHAKDGTCAKTKRLAKNYCPAACTYRAAFGRATGSATAILNPWNYEAIGSKIRDFFRENLVIDEAHGLVGYLFGSCEYRVWRHIIPWGDGDDVTKPDVVLEILKRALIKWADQLAQAHLVHNDYAIKEADEEIGKLNRAIGALTVFGDDVLISIKNEVFHGKTSDEWHMKFDDVIHIKPKRIDKIAHRMWPSEVKKIILMSATIGPDIIEELGLKDRKVAYFECESPIPVKQRRCVYWPVANMAYKQREQSLPKLAAAILKTAERFPNQKGFIHCTYDVAKKLSNMLSASDQFGRFIFHDKRSKRDQYDDFRSSKEPKIMVGSGMSEGIDLAGDAARWQIITMVTYPSLQDDVNKWRMNAQKPKWLAEACRTIQQQYGRVCRGPNDEGITIILDQQFYNLYCQTRHQGVWPKWFLDATEGLPK